MKPFTYERVTDVRAAGAAVLRPGAKFISGGTNLLDLMKLEIEQPTHLVDISRLPLKQIEDVPGGGIRIGAQAANSDVAGNDRVRALYPVLSEALLSGASGQLRNKASDRRKSPSAHAMLVFLRHRGGVQQTDPGNRLRGTPGCQPHTRDPRRERRLHRQPPFRHGRRVGGVGRRDRSAESEPIHPHAWRSTAFIALRGHAAHRNRAGARRDDHRRDPSAAAPRAPASIARCATEPRMSSPWSRSR